MVDYQELCRQWEEKKQIPGRGVGDNMELEMLKTSNTVLTKRCDESEEQMVSLRTRLAKAEELALAKQYQNSELQNRVALLESELETLPILRTQVLGIHSQSYWINLTNCRFVIELKRRWSCTRRILKLNVQLVKTWLEKKTFWHSKCVSWSDKWKICSHRGRQAPLPERVPSPHRFPRLL